MWVLGTKGAVSIVHFNHAPEGDPKTVQVRSRRKEWLQSFAVYVDRKVQLIHSDNKDYQWRFFATPDEVADMVARATRDITYSNFKNATSSAEHGLKTPKLRWSLHDAYSSIWSTLLNAGDGTSVFNKPFSSGYSKGKAGTIDICRDMGHWYASGSDKCDDCGMKRPAGHKGAQGGKPTKAQVAAWWKARGGRNAAKATTQVQSAGEGKKVYSNAAHAKSLDAKPVGGEGSLTCAGSWTHAAKGSLNIEKGVASGECVVCRERIPLTLDSWQIRMHWKSSVVDDVVDQIPAPATIEDLEAERDAAVDNYLDVEERYQREEATVEEVEHAITIVTDAEAALFDAKRDESIKASA